MSEDFFGIDPSKTPPRPEPAAEAGGKAKRRFWPWARRDRPAGGEGSGWRARLLRHARLLAILILAGLLLYYPLGAFFVHRVDDDIDFAPPAMPANASQAVAMAAALIDREVAGTAWPANDPWFFPGAILDNMPNFQKGEIQALQIFATELRDQIGRARGTSAPDSDLQDAAGGLNNKPDIWYFDLSRAWIPVTPSTTYYLDSMRKFANFNARLIRDEAVFERRADNLIALLDRIGKDLGGASNQIDRQIDENSGAWIDWHADDVFYFNKGRVYAYALLLRELGVDFKSVIAEKGAATIWQRMVASLSEGASLRPAIVINGEPGALFQPNHLASQGFYLLRARAQLEEIVDILQK